MSGITNLLFIETRLRHRSQCVLHLSFVLFLLRAVAFEPEFAEPIPNVTVAVGRDAIMPCVVERLGTYKVAWVHIDKQMILTIHYHVITRNHRFSVSHSNHRSWLLHIRSVQEDDRGYYMCQINTTPMKSQVGYLEVVVPPDILDEESSSSNVRIREGANVSLTCRANGYPSPRIMWRREDNQPFLMGKKHETLIDGEDLNITKTSRVHMGAYLCIASNGIPPSISKRIMLDVEFSPMIWIPNQLVGAPGGSEVTLDCHTEAYPKSVNYWTRDGSMLMSNTKYETKEDDSNLYKIHMRLKIRMLENKDFGSYKCIAKNNLGETEGSIGLYELKNEKGNNQNFVRSKNNMASLHQKSTAILEESQTGDNTQGKEVRIDQYDTGGDISAPSDAKPNSDIGSSSVAVASSERWIWAITVLSAILLCLIPDRLNNHHL